MKEIYKCPKCKEEWKCITTQGPRGTPDKIKRCDDCTDGICFLPTYYRREICDKCK